MGALAAGAARATDVPLGRKGVMLMNRIAPSISKLMIANLDGSNERNLLADTMFEYNG